MMDTNSAAHAHERHVNGRYIVRAVNSHDALIEALKQCISLQVDYSNGLEIAEWDRTQVLNCAKATLAQAQGEKA